jgi:hypothetical protein
MFKIVLSEVPPPETIVPDLDPAFSSIIAKSMARDLTQRFQSTADFIKALDAWMRTGASVSVPPAADAAAVGLVPTSGAGARTAMGSQTNINRGTATPGPGTGGNWASSQPDVAPTGLPKKSSAGVLAGLAAVAILVVGGVAFGAYSILGKKAEPEAASSAAAPSSLPAAAALGAGTPPSTTNAEPKPDLAATPPAPTAPTPAASSAPAAASAAPAAPIAAARPAAVARPGTKPAPAPAKPGAKPAAAPAKPGGGTPDFGY